MKVEIGQYAPQFALKSDLNEEISLSDLKGKNVILYFYPKDDTPGCTIEAQDFSKKVEQFEKLNSLVIGISRDSIKSHCKFIEKYDLKLTLLSDHDGDVCNRYDVIKEKSMMGKKYIGIERSTFLIDKIGKVLNIWRAVKVKGHVDEVLQIIKTIEK